MQYLTPKDLKKMMLLSYERIEKEKEEINKINVFPVPDQDTGNNIAKTLLGIKEAIEQKEFESLNELSEKILDGALTAAQGNAGVIYTGFLAGFLGGFNKNTINLEKLAEAFKSGAERAKSSIQNPKEGTILDVINAAASTFTKEKTKETNIIEVFKKATKNASQALLETREKMEIFKKANVVDAGGLAFLIILESYLEALEGKKKTKEKEEKEKASKKIKRFIQIISNRYEVVCLLKNPKFPEKEIRKKLIKLGNYLDIVQIKEKMKIHIHTDYPDEVKEVMRSLGKIQHLRTEDMANEVVGEESLRTVSIGLVIDNTSMLLPKIIERYQIEKVSSKYNRLEEKNFSEENIYQKLKKDKKLKPNSVPVSQSLKQEEFLTSFKRQLERFDKVLCITSSSKILDSYEIALKTKAAFSDSQKITILDSLNIAAGQDLLILRAIELIQEQREMNEIIEELKKTIPNIHLYLSIENPFWTTKSLGFYTKNKIKKIIKPQINWVKKVKRIKVHPIIELRDGTPKKGGVVFAKNAQEALFKKLVKATKKDIKRGKKIRIIIGHVDNIESAKDLKQKIKKVISVDIPFIGLIPPVLCNITGPGSLVIAWTSVE